MSAGLIMLAFHGCDVTVRDRLVRGELRHLEPSRNRYDWLGQGAYFFHGDCERALRFSRASQRQPQALLTAKPIRQASVVGAVLCISTLLDMTTQAGMKIYREAHQALMEHLRRRGKPMPAQRTVREGESGARLRLLDCAVINTAHRLRRERGLPPFQAVRGAFYQGPPIAPGSEFREDSHVQVALCDPDCVKGWFIPPETQERLLSDEELALADRNMQMAVLARSREKPRVRVNPGDNPESYTLGEAAAPYLRAPRQLSAWH